MRMKQSYGELWHEEQGHHMYHRKDLEKLYPSEMDLGFLARKPRLAGDVTGEVREGAGEVAPGRIWARTTRGRHWAARWRAARRSRRRGAMVAGAAEVDGGAR